MKTTRRDLLKFAGGCAAGVMLTPAPWRVITDTAIWSENWPGVPQPARGEIRTRYTNCALCPAGCPVRARCVGDQPVSLAGLPGKPLCALGLAGHQMPYHAGRIFEADTSGAAAEIRARIRSGPAAILDLRPGRTASWTWRRLASSLPHGIYLAPQRNLPAVNLRTAKNIVSFGVPVLDGWGTPGNVVAARPNFRLIQVEPDQSNTAALADVWLPLDYKSGISERQVVDLKAQLSDGPTLVLAGDDAPAILELNRTFGGWGHTVVARTEAPVPETWRKTAAPITALTAVPDGALGLLLPDGALGLLLIDESTPDAVIPWQQIEPKLAPDALIVTFASWREGYGRHARFVLPTAVYPEVSDDIPPAIDSPAAQFRLAVPLVKAPPGVVDPVRFVAEIAAFATGDPLRERAEAIQSSGEGQLVMPDNSKPNDFFKALQEGGCWIGPEPKPAAPQWQPNEAIWMPPKRPVPPLFSKLYQESSLRNPDPEVRL